MLLRLVRVPADRFAVRARGPRYLMRAAGALLAPALTVRIGMWRWRRSLDPDWVGATEQWLERYRDGTVEP